jgi:hypothetical protein
LPARQPSSDEIGATTKKIKQPETQEKPEKMKEGGKK